MKTFLFAALIGTSALALAGGAYAEGTSSGAAADTSSSSSYSSDTSVPGGVSTDASTSSNMSSDSMSSGPADSSYVPPADVSASADVQSTAPVDSTQLSAAQEALNAQGYRVATDGIMGPKTEAAIRSYQQANSLTPTGALDTQTMKALNVSDTSGGMSGGGMSGGMSGQSSTSTSY